jgi:hypothetical protein
MTTKRWALSLTLLSAAVLGYEILLMRLLSMAWWGHFASLVIAIALLGFASSGIALHFLHQRVTARPEAFLAIGSILFSVTAPLVFPLSQQIPFTPFLLTWSGEAYAHLALRCSLLWIPFFFGGLGIGAAYLAHGCGAARAYLWNMLGSALPAPLLLAGYAFAHPATLLTPLSSLGLLAAAATGGRARALVCIATAAAGFLLSPLLPFQSSEYKDLSKTLSLSGSRLLEERYDPRGVISVVDAPAFRFQPGLSLNFDGQLPGARFLFTDGEGAQVAYRPDDVAADTRFLTMSPEALAYELGPVQNVLLLSAGGGLEILRARALGAETIVALENNSAHLAALRSSWSGESSSPLVNPRISLLRESPRRFLSTSRAAFDLVHLSLVDLPGMSSAGGASLNPSYLLTLDAFREAWKRVSPTGRFLITGWVENPPRAAPRAAATAVAALKAEGITNPGNHMIAIRGWSTFAIVILQEPITGGAIARSLRLCDENSFDPVFFPGITDEVMNRNNAIPDTPYESAFRALTGDASRDFLERYPFGVHPVGDNRPFFGHFFRWDAVPHLTRTMGMEWLPHIEWGYVVHAATLAVVILLGILILIIPCAAARFPLHPRSFALFFTLGAAYMFLEIWAIYVGARILGDQTMAASAVLGLMLAASGAGGGRLVGPTLTGVQTRRRLAALVALPALAVIALTSLAPLLARSGLMPSLLAFGALIAIPAFAMGFPFPFALGRVADSREIPWALALNGLGSVVGAQAATLVAVHAGILELGMAGVALYGVVAVLLVLRQAEEKR